MSATLTPERKSARDRPGVGHNIKWGIRGEKEGEHIGASTEELVVRRPARNQVQTHAPRRAVPDPHASRAPPGRLPSCRFIRRRLSLRDRCCAAARGAARRRRHASLCCSLSCAKALPLLHLWHIAGTCVARAHACVRYGAWAGCGAHSESRSSIALPPPRQPLLSGPEND